LIIILLFVIIAFCYFVNFLFEFTFVLFILAFSLFVSIPTMSTTRSKRAKTESDSTSSSTSAVTGYSSDGKRSYASVEQLWSEEFEAGNCAKADDNQPIDKKVSFSLNILYLPNIFFNSTLMFSVSSIHSVSGIKKVPIIGWLVQFKVNEYQH
jgi:competence protein ComGC